MRGASAIGLVLSLALAIAACGGGDESTTAQDTTAAEAAEPVTVELAEANDSGFSGTATLTPSGEGDAIPTFEAAVSVTPPSDDPQLAAIHENLCADYHPEIPEDATLDEIFDAVSADVADELGEVRDGELTVTVPGALVERTTGEYSLIVHDNAPPYTPVACGDIPGS